jgi:hypothetical protein
MFLARRSCASIAASRIVPLVESPRTLAKRMRASKFRACGDDCELLRRGASRFARGGRINYPQNLWITLWIGVE